MFATKIIYAIELVVEIFASKFVVFKMCHCPIDCCDGHDLFKP